MQTNNLIRFWCRECEDSFWDSNKQTSYCPNCNSVEIESFPDPYNTFVNNTFGIWKKILIIGILLLIIPLLLIGQLWYTISKWIRNKRKILNTSKIKLDKTKYES